MRTLEEAIKALIKEQYGSVTKFGSEIDVPPSSIYSALDRGMANTRTELTDKIYRALNIDWDTARLDDEYRELKVKSTPTGFVDVPLYGSIAAGTPMEMVSSESSQPVPIEVQCRYPSAFLLRVRGESMNRVLPNGCFALIDPEQREPMDRKAYAVCVNGYDATIKRVRRLQNGFELAPDSLDPTYKPMVYDYGEPGTETVTIIGRVVYYVLPFDWEV